MSIPNLPVNFKDDILAATNLKRKYNLIQNDDETVSFEDATEYQQTGSYFGAGQINATNDAINKIYSERILSLEEAALVTEPGFFVDAMVVSELIGNLFEQKILWSGYYLMTSNHTARLSEPISAMTRGVTLIFSKYTGGQPRDYNFQSYYIPKKVIEILPAGPGFQVPIYDGDNIGYKYLYIHDEEILGTDSNETPPNNLYVLRYVIGE